VNIGRKILLIFTISVVVVGGAIAFQYQSYRARQILTLATTTSLYDSGLLDYLIPRFSEASNVEVRILAKGTGESIEIAKRGDVDMVLVHSRLLEEEFIAGGYGVHRVGVMYNDFIIVGPGEDPAQVSGLKDAKLAFSKIEEAGKSRRSVFVSRADRSGTHLKELEIWGSLGFKPSSSVETWYIEIGSGMGAALRMANEKRAYVLTDRGTWASFKDQLSNLKVLVEGDSVLLNPYAAILVNPMKHPHRNFKVAMAFVKFLVSEEGQSLIRDFRKGDERLFWPMARDFQRAAQLGFPDQAKEVSWYDTQTSPSGQIAILVAIILCSRMPYCYTTTSFVAESQV